MKYKNTIELILPSESYSAYWDQKKLVKWLTTTVQCIIVQQQVKTKKISLGTMKDTRQFTCHEYKVFFYRSIILLLLLFFKPGTDGQENFINEYFKSIST